MNSLVALPIVVAAPTAAPAMVPSAPDPTFAAIEDHDAQTTRDPDAELVAMGERFAELSEQLAHAEELEEPQREEIERAVGMLRSKYGSGKIPKDELRAVRPAAEAKFPYLGPNVEDLGNLIVPLGEKINEMEAHTLARFKAKALLVHHWPAIDLGDHSDEWWPNKVLRDLMSDLIGYEQTPATASRAPVSDETTKLAANYETLLQKYVEARVRWAGAEAGTPISRAADDEMCEIHRSHATSRKKD